MKRFFLSAITGSLMFFTACNNESGTSAESGNADSSGSTGTMSSESSTASQSGNNASQSGNNVMSKTGLILSANNEVPVNNSTGTGTADVKYDKNTKMLTYTVNWSGLTEKPNMAHIHGTAPKGANAGVKQDLTGLLVKETKGSFTDSVKIDGSRIKEDSLLSGFYYFNIHTPKNPAGEIRGQIEF